jgi:hypothetical protein
MMAVIDFEVKKLKVKDRIGHRNVVFWEPFAWYASNSVHWYILKNRRTLIDFKIEKWKDKGENGNSDCSVSWEPFAWQTKLGVYSYVQFDPWPVTFFLPRINRGQWLFMMYQCTKFCLKSFLKFYCRYILNLSAMAKYHWPICWIICFKPFVRLSFP